MIFLAPYVAAAAYTCGTTLVGAGLRYGPVVAAKLGMNPGGPHVLTEALEWSKETPFPAKANAAVPETDQFTVSPPVYEPEKYYHQPEQ